jgi:hypothetical protein
MTIFDYIKQIFVQKDEGVSLEHYNPYLINRWLSFINPTICNTINHFNSKMLLEDKALHYKIMLASFPKVKYVPKIEYIKKKKNELTELTELQKHFARSLEISVKELQDLEEFQSSLNSTN